MENSESTPLSDDSLYFNIQADFGFTKHPGGMQATRELVKACHIGRDCYVLVIGCGVGQSPCLIAEESGSKVIGIDLSEGMVEKARERAKRKGLEDRVEFHVVNAQDLHFENNRFDAVLCESVNAFIPDKGKAMSEYIRVIKPGGYVGMNEVYWEKQPSPDLRKYAAIIMAGANFLSVEGWTNLMIEAGLTEVHASCYKLDMRQQRIDEIKSFDKGEGLQAWKRFLKGLFTDPIYWKFTKQVLSKPGMMFQFMKHISYGIFVGKKASSD